MSIERNNTKEWNLYFRYKRTSHDLVTNHDIKKKMFVKSIAYIFLFGLYNIWYDQIKFFVLVLVLYARLYYWRTEHIWQFANQFY